MRIWGYRRFLIGWVLLYLIFLGGLKAEESSPEKPARDTTETTDPALLQSESSPSLTNPSSPPSMEERSLDTRGVIKVPDPHFIREGSLARSQGVYFGVGFQQVRLDFRRGRTITNNDSAINGVAFNLGYFSENQIYEYARHVTILDLGEILVLEGRDFNFVEVIQNNGWYFQVSRLTLDWYLHYGAGVQITEARLILRATQGLEAASELHREDSFLIGGGGAYFVTPNFFIQYRFTIGAFSPLITGPNVNNAMHSTQIHTLFFQYYFSL